MTTKWTINVEEDPETGDAIIKFPEDLLEVAGWQEGDILNWKDLGDGTWSLTKQESDVTIEEEEAWRDLERKQSKA